MDAFHPSKGITKRFRHKLYRLSYPSTFDLFYQLPLILAIPLSRITGSQLPVGFWIRVLQNITTIQKAVRCGLKLWLAYNNTLLPTAISGTI
jgi:hypothetical protein